MRPLLLLAALLIGCASEAEDPHAVLACGEAWNGSHESCEAACAARPKPTGGACLASAAGGIPLQCAATFDGEFGRGCCGSDGDLVRFRACEE